MRKLADLLEQAEEHEFLEAEPDLSSEDDVAEYIETTRDKLPEIVTRLKQQAQENDDIFVEHADTLHGIYVNGEKVESVPDIQDFLPVALRSQSEPEQQIQSSPDSGAVSFGGSTGGHRPSPVDDVDDGAVASTLDDQGSSSQDGSGALSEHKDQPLELPEDVSQPVKVLVDHVEGAAARTDHPGQPAAPAGNVVQPVREAASIQSQPTTTIADQLDVAAAPMLMLSCFRRPMMKSSILLLMMKKRFRQTADGAQGADGEGQCGKARYGRHFANPNGGQPADGIRCT